jgi:hypothetical protein
MVEGGVERDTLEHHAVAPGAAVSAALCADCQRRRPPVGFSICQTCTAQRLREHTEALADRLLPGGSFDGRWYRTSSVAGGDGDSLVLELAGKKRGRWKDYAGSDDEYGDLLDLVRLSPHSGANGDPLHAMRYAHDLLLTRPPSPADAIKRGPRRGQPATDKQRREIADRIWHESKPVEPGDWTSRYLEGRGIDLGRLPPIRALRTHPALWHQSGREFPAMVAAIVGLDGKRLGVHRTWVCEKDGKVVKAPVKPQKMSLGNIVGGCIPLTMGPTGRPWSDPEEGERVDIAEGIEDGLSRARRRRVVCGISLSCILEMDLLAAYATVGILVQNDKASSKTDRLLEKVRRRFQRMGKRVIFERPRDRGEKDINDVLQRLVRQRAERAAARRAAEQGPDVDFDPVA